MALTRYQQRMRKFIFASVAYVVLFPAGMAYFSAPRPYWLIYLSTLILLYSLAAGFDAVYDSLGEQSSVDE